MKTISITSEQYKALGRKLPKKNVAVRSYSEHIGQYSQIISRTVAKANHYKKDQK